MGGIFGAVSVKGYNVLSFVLDRLKLLEYRGFDGSGIAILADKDRLVVYKDMLRVDRLVERYGLRNLSTSIALGVTRYATHGKPHILNTQPHMDCSGSIAVVGDGAIADYESLRDELLFKEHNIVSKCDIEAVAHLIEDRVREKQEFRLAFLDAVGRVDGFYTLAALDSRSRCLALHRKGPPLYIGFSDNFIVISSGLAAICSLSDRYIELRPGETIFIETGSGEVDIAGGAGDIESRATTLILNIKYIDRGGYPHHMLREIHEIPQALLRTLYSVQKRYLMLAAKLVAEADRVYIIGNGSSLHAGYIASYYLSELANISPIVVSSAEFPLYYADVAGPGTIVIAISQSGESREVISAVYEAKLRGASILALTNFIGSKLSNFSNVYLPIGAGPEMAVPATKTFTSTLLLLYMLALETGKQKKRVQPQDIASSVEFIKKLSLDLQSNLKAIEVSAESVAKALSICRNGYVVSRGITYPLALEGALKFKEVSYIHAEGVEMGEYRHGPQVLLEENFFTVFITPVERVAQETLQDLVKSAYEKKATVVTIGFEHEKKLMELDIEIPKVLAPSTTRHLAPIALTVPLYLIVYKLGVALGRPIDAPRYLAKVIQ